MVFHIPDNPLIKIDVPELEEGAVIYARPYSWDEISKEMGIKEITPNIANWQIDNIIKNCFLDPEGTNPAFLPNQKEQLKNHVQLIISIRAARRREALGATPDPLDEPTEDYTD